MFGRKMKTKLPQNLKKKKGSDREEEEARARHDLKKSQQKEAFDKKQKAKEKKLIKGDEVLIQQKKSSVKSPWDPEGVSALPVVPLCVGLELLFSNHPGESLFSRPQSGIVPWYKRPT